MGEFKCDLCFFNTSKAKYCDLLILNTTRKYSINLGNLWSPPNKPRVSLEMDNLECIYLWCYTAFSFSNLETKGEYSSAELYYMLTLIAISLIYSSCLSYFNRGNNWKDLFRASSCRRCCIWLPLLVLMRVCIIVNTLDHEATEVVY